MSGQKRKNVLVLFTDDQRFDTIGALGNDEIMTPNMDKLVARGVTFTHAHIPGGTSGAVCMPSRAMLHTGRTLFHLQGAGQDVPEEHVLMGEAFQGAGYRTFGTGKWHNGHKAYARSFTDGAEIFFGGMEDHWNVPAHHFDPTGEYDNVIRKCNNFFYSRETGERLCDHVTPGKHSSELFAEAGMEFLEGYDDEKPFLMYVSFMAPHDPRTMPQEYLDMYDPSALTLPANFMPEHPFDKGHMRVRDEVLAPFPRTPEEVKQHLAEYYAMITHLDAQIGRILETLEKTGHAEDTIVVLAGDNGLALGQHGLFGKQNSYDHSIRVPLIMAGPGIPENERRDAYVYLLDIFPTLCELTGVERPGSVEGESLVTALMDNDEKVRETIFSAYVEYQRSVRDRQYKLIEYCVDGKRTTQLFDMEADPWEMTNLAGEKAMAGKVAELREALGQWRDRWDDRQSEWGASFWSTYDASA